MQIAPTPHDEIVGSPPIQLTKPLPRLSLRSSSQRLRNSFASLARSLSTTSSSSLSSSPSCCSSGSIRRSSNASFANKRKRVRFAKKAPSLHHLPPRGKDAKEELWWSAGELEKMSVSEVMHSLCLAGDPSIGNYLVSSDYFQQHVCDHRRPASSYEADHILAGLNLGYRGIEKWTDLGRFRRIESREFVKKLVYDQRSMSPEQIQELCAAHSYEFIMYANATAYLDALVVNQ